MSKTASTETDQPVQDAADDAPTLEEIAPEFPCRIRESANVHVSKILRLDEDGTLDEDTGYSRPDWGTVETERYYCEHCTEDFETIEAAQKHIQTKYRQFKQRYRLLPAQSRSDIKRPKFCDESVEITLPRVTVKGRKSKMMTSALITSGVDAAIAVARRVVKLPDNLSFEDWDALSDDGVLTYPDGKPRLDPELLRGVFIELLGGDQLGQSSSVRLGEEFTLYDLGQQFLVTGRGRAVLIAPKTHPDYT